MKEQITDTPLITALIVDDEKDACINLQSLLRYIPDIDLCIHGIAHSTAEAEVQIRLYNPDVVFLDIEMANENAFTFLSRIGAFRFEIIFLTAYDQYAIQAFKLNAVDYILKPIDPDELRNALTRLKERLRYKHFVQDSGYNDLIHQVNTGIKPDRIILRNTNATEIINFSDVLFIEAKGSYSKFFFLKDRAVNNITMSYPLAEYKEILPGDQFFRSHRSYLINCAHITRFIKSETYEVLIYNKFQLPVGRRRYHELLEFIKKGV